MPLGPYHLKPYPVWLRLACLTKYVNQEDRTRISFSNHQPLGSAYYTQGLSFLELSFPCWKQQCTTWQTQKVLVSVGGERPKAIALKRIE